MMVPKRILQINCTSNWGSTGKIAEGIGLAAREAGYEMAIAFGRYENPSQFQTFNAVDKWATYVHYGLSRVFDGEGLGSHRATKILIRDFEKFSPDIVHLHNIHDHWLNYPMLFRWIQESNAKIVWTFHDCWAFTGGCMYFPVTQGNTCSRWTHACFGCAERKGKIDRSRRNFELKKELFLSLKDRLTIVPVSEWLGGLVRQSFLKDCNIQVIQNGIDLAAFKPCATKQSKHILAVSNVWDERKGLKDVIALKKLLPSDFSMTIIGLSDKQLHDLPEDIIGMARTQSLQELAEEYSKATLLVNTTYQDTFPTVNLEALACGTPVITYRTGGSPEAIDDKTGIVVEQGKIKTMAEAVKQACERLFNSEDCRIRAEKHFCKETQFMQYVKLYDSILSK